MKPRDVAHLLSRYRVTDGSKFRLKDFAPDDRGGLDGARDDADALLAENVARLATLQEKLYAQADWSLLVAFQGIDASGKDGTIRHAMTGVNPAGIQVTSFKQPGPEDLVHDFLWRIHAAVPQRGRIGIFNRSHYEEVLVCRVHPDLLDHQHLPEAVRGKKFWKHRLADIAAFEEYLSRQGVVVLKFFLNLSKEEQKKRFLARIDQPGKNWKFSTADLHERDFWDDYQDAFESAIAATAAPHAPWYVVPADHKWFCHLIVVAAMVDALRKLDLQPPELSAEEQAMVHAARVKLEGE